MASRLEDLFVSYKNLGNEHTQQISDPIGSFGWDRVKLIIPEVQQSRITTEQSPLPTLVESLSTSLSENNTSSSTVPTSSSANRTVRFMGKDINLQNAVDIITKNLAITANNKKYLHTCTRHVANALKGQTNPDVSGGIANPSKMYEQLLKDGWVDVLSDNYTPQVGDVYTVWGASGGKYGMHTSMWNGEKWLSYNADNKGGPTPWYFNQRGKSGVKMHIMRFGSLPASSLRITKNLKGGIIKAREGTKIEEVANYFSGIKPLNFTSQTISNPFLNFNWKSTIVDTPLQLVITTLQETPLPVLSEPNQQSIQSPQQVQTELQNLTGSLTIKLSGDKNLWKEQMILAYKRAGCNDLFAKFLTALDALETGWGKHVVGDYNYGNIKTGRSWTGKSRRAHDKREGSYDAYRSYNTVDEYVADKLRLLKGRYKMTGLESAEEFTNKLVAGGYATGKQYKQHVMSVIKSI